jgi:ribosomal 30S subunit maturation factor RimM
MLDVQRGHSTIMIPYRPEIVVRTDIEARTIVVNDTLGLLDDTSDSSE